MPQDSLRIFLNDINKPERNYRLNYFTFCYFEPFLVLFLQRLF